MDNKLKERVQSKSKDPIFLFSSYGNVQSRYLREPLGSCHDICKHGLKHESVDNKKHLISRRFMANSIASDAMQSTVKGRDIGIAKRVSRIKTKAPEKAIFLHDIIQQDKQEAGLFEKSVNSNVVTSLSINERAVNSTQIILLSGQEQNARSLSKDNEFPENSSIIFQDPSPAFASIELLKAANFPIRTKQKIQEQLDDDEKAELVSDENNNIDPVTPSFENKSCEIFPVHIISKSPAKETNGVVVLNSIKKMKKQVKKQEVTSMQKPSHVKRNILKPKKSSSSILLASRADLSIPTRKLISKSKETIKSATIRVIKHRKAFLKEESASPEIQRSSQTASIPSRKLVNYAKPVISLRSRTPLVRSMSHISASRNLNCRSKLEQNANKNNEMPNVGKVILNPSKDSVPSTTPSWSAISLKSRKSTYAKHATSRKVGKSTEILGGIHEKVLEIIKEKPPKCQDPHEEKSFTNIGNGHASKSASEGSELFDNEKVCSKPRRVTVKEEDMRQAKRSPAFQSNNNSSSPYKLRFKRGKVIEVRTSEVVGPKRLRFRRGRVLGENISSEVAQRSFRRRRDMIDSNDLNSGAHDVTLKQTNSEAKVVMLKHQDAQEKKDMQALLNHVIEETASKLVETRKSKVKALVGAFETVISLQETKQTAAV